VVVMAGLPGSMKRLCAARVAAEACDNADRGRNPPRRKRDATAFRKSRGEPVAWTTILGAD
jgi:hypothetical protein